jgi:hypothetical protein
VIVAAAVCPHPPLLFRELTGQQDVAAELRAACLSVVGAAISASPDLVVVVGGAVESAAWDASLPVGVRGFGTTGPRDGPGLPLSLAVGKRLLLEAGWSGPVQMTAVGWTASLDEVTQVAEKLAGRPERIALVVLGDGSARRGEKAPGYIDDRAFPFDEAIGRSLASGDPDALLGLDPTLAEELMVGGRAAFQTLASVVRLQESRPKAEVVYVDDPFGVMYFVALWNLAEEAGSSIS